MTVRPLYLALGLLLAACTPPSEANRPPTVSAGNDQTVFLPAEDVPLSGSATDLDGDILSTTWAQSGGPEGVAFADVGALETTATFPAVGVYTLTLSASDGVERVSDEVTITVEPESPRSTGSWEELPPSSEARQEVSYVQLGGLFYLAGGSTLHEVYDPVARTWSVLEPLPQNLDHIQGAAVGGLIYYLGGNVGGNLRKETDTVYIYDPATDTFSQGAPLPEGRGAGGVAVFENKIYYAGGLRDFEAQPSFYVYDPAADTWAELPEMPHARDHFHAAVLDGVFYAIGGREARINATRPFVDAFDFETQTWTTLPTELPTERGGFASAVLGGEILVIGGEGGGNTYGEVEAYDPETNAWRTLEPMPTPRHGIQAAVCSGAVYIAAGGVIQGVGPSTEHEVFFLGEPTDCAAG